ncbi:uncharacterized protein TNCT_597991 [Trichonephila clavata]|uniref:Uncharacterized protein n=1 Tax=Trichonephila clavata TaxID=2740835 RepID=A0A8X6HM43_TRICU|nr:uncharacterized protein TNCT_597991 [Trichonephila clavata]
MILPQGKKKNIIFKLEQMERGKERNNEKDSSGETSSESKGKLPSSRIAGANWNVMAVRGKVTDRCLWSACKAMTAGFLFIVVGAGMATLGFYSDHLSKVEETRGNTTIWIKNESKDSHLGSLTYFGPVVMGIGGFTIVAACVMTFEARDTAAKIVPIWFKRTRIHVVSGGSGSTPSGRSSKASWERFLSQQRSSEDAGDTRTAVTQALVDFSKYLQNNVDTNKILLQNSISKNQQMMGIRKCPSEPSLAKNQRDPNANNIPEEMTLLETSTPQPSQRRNYGGGLKTITGSSKPQLLSVAPDTYRQAVSMDCPRSNRYDGENKEDHIAVTVAKASLQASDKSRITMLPLQTSCATSSSGSMSVDIYLPQGSVTLKIHDDMKDHKKTPLKPADSSESRYTKFSQQSDMNSFENDEEMSAELDDSVFFNPDTCISTPQIVLETMDSLKRHEISHNNNHFIPIERKSTSSIDQWVSGHSAFPHTESKSESLEVHTPEESPISPNFSFERSETNSLGTDIDSVISNPFSSKMCAQPSLSPTDTSFFNISSLNSMGSSKDISSPQVFCGSPKCFDYTQDPASGNQSIGEYAKVIKSFDIAESKMEISKKKLDYFSESSRNLVSITLASESIRTSPRKHSSLESAQIQSSKTHPKSSESPKGQQLSLESPITRLSEDPFLIPPMSPRFLSPQPVSPTILTFSPRKTRSDSMPERRQAPSLKRFPLLRQGALDSFAEEGGHRLDRSQTQISPKDP